MELGGESMSIVPVVPACDVALRVEEGVQSIAAAKELLYSLEASIDEFVKLNLD